MDRALNAADYDRLSAHLAGCAACRRDIQDLLTVHELIRANVGPAAGPPAGLSQRLAAIPGSEAPKALARWSRPGGAGFGSRRRARLRATVAVFAGAATLTVLGVTGYAAAPADLVAVSDPSVDAEAEFSSALGQFPLSTGTLSTGTGTFAAVSRSNHADLSSKGQAAAALSPGLATGDVVPAAAALAGLRRAAASAESINYVAQQNFVAYGSERTYTARVQVVSQSGQGGQINVVSQNGRALASDVSRAAGSSRMADDEVLSLLERNYELSGVRGSVVAGRPATMLQASRGGTVAGRWWVDDENGLILWQQRLDPSGQLQVSTGFTTLDLTDRPELVLHLPPRPVLPATNVALTLSNTGPLRAGGWVCHPDLAGLVLVKLRADRAADPETVHLIYSDGLATVSVLEQRGQLAGIPANSSWEAAARAYVQRGATNLASWESGDTVITVITDGSPELLAQAVASLPHEPPHERTTMERIQAGWGRILATARG